MENIQLNQQHSKIETITLGGGCFWCLDGVYAGVRGVLRVQSGYCNGQIARPSYEMVCGGTTGCVEVVQLTFDLAQISLSQLLEIFFVVHDPTMLNAQGHDRGTQYRSGIYYQHDAQKTVADDMIRQMSQDKLFDRSIVTEVLALANFWPAEDYHQDYFANNPSAGYCAYVVVPKVQKFRQTFTSLIKK